MDLLAFNVLLLVLLVLRRHVSVVWRITISTIIFVIRTVTKYLSNTTYLHRVLVVLFVLMVVILVLVLFVLLV